MTQHQHTYRTMPASDEYRDGWDRIFGKKVREIPRIVAPGRAIHDLPAEHPGKEGLGREGT